MWQVLQILVAVALAGVILIQSQETGLGRAFGGVSYRSKKGLEKTFFGLTIFLAGAFVLLSVINILD